MPQYAQVVMLENTYYPEAGGRLAAGDVLDLESSLAERWERLDVCEILEEVEEKPKAKRGRPTSTAALKPQDEDEDDDKDAEPRKAQPAHDDDDEDELTPEEEQRRADGGVPVEVAPPLNKARVATKTEPKVPSKGNYTSSISRGSLSGDSE
jgi:hypothetical protein